PLQLINVNSSYLYTLPLETFTGVNQSVLIYSAQQSSGLKLPDWLRFNGTTRQLSGRPNATVAGRYELALMATTPVGAQAVANFSLIAEYFPEVLQSIIPPLADINSAFSFTVPSNSFIDRDGDLLTYTAQRQGGSVLPNWLTFNRQSLSFSGVPLETDKGDLPLQIVATDPAGASVTQNMSIQVIHFPTLAHPQPTMTIRAGESFNFSLLPNIFTDSDQVGLSYSTNPLPSWLTFDSQTLSFSGKASSIESTSLTVIATDTRGASKSMSFQLVMRGNVLPIAVEEFLSNQAAKVGQTFSYFLPTPLFIDAHNNTLSYSASQQDGSVLPAWLHFDNESLHFSGTPGHGDTNFYSTRVVGVKVTAESEEGRASTSFNVNVDGMSWGELAVNIGAPLVSVLTTLYAVYEARALWLNYWRKKNYTLLENKNPTVTMGQRFSYNFEKVHNPELIHDIQAVIAYPEGRCCQFFRPRYKRLPGGNALPYWLKYDTHHHVLTGKVPNIDIRDSKKLELVIQAKDEAGIILEQFTLKILKPEKDISDFDIKELKVLSGPPEKEEKYEKDRLKKKNQRKSTEEEKAAIELMPLDELKVQSPTSVTKPLIEIKKLSEKNLSRDDSVHIPVKNNTPPSQKKQLSDLGSQSITSMGSKSPIPERAAEGDSKKEKGIASYFRGCW
ncbi:MAG: putative Ig domain-containing protein, partial [Proteobacteria bacterium]|nr:putative Ig domain-containing protein [Pseudomonadota bacterium]